MSKQSSRKWGCGCHPCDPFRHSRKKRSYPKNISPIRMMLKQSSLFSRAREYGIDFIAPTRADHKWQAKEQQGFDAGSLKTRLEQAENDLSDRARELELDSSHRS